jgi:hypothetical protein
MANLSITRSVVNGVVFTQTQNETQMSDIETFVNTTKLTGTDNIQAGSILTANIAANAITSSLLAANAVGTSAIADSAITTAKIAANAVTAAKLDTAIVDNSTIAISSNQLIVKDAGITQAKLAPRATGTSVAAGGVATSLSCGSFANTSSSYIDVTNLSVTITTTGRPVMVSLIADGGTSGFNYMASGAGVLTVKYLNSTTATTLAEYSVFDITPGTAPVIDYVVAGTYTYKIQTKANDNAGHVYYMKLVAFEL